MAVPTVNIPKPRRFKVVFMNGINNCCPSYVAKARHLASWPNRPRSVQNRNYSTSDRERSKKQIVSYTRASRWCNLFSLQFALGLHSLFSRMQKNQFKENPKTSPKTTKEATKENKNEVADGHENEAKSPWKNLEGRPICSLHKKISIFFLFVCFCLAQTGPNDIRMRSLVPRERNYVASATSPN